jgi:hypothetical protein
MLIIETLFGGEPSMDNPPTVTVPDISIGDTFTFKGDRCQILRVSKNKAGFWYSRQQSADEAFMNFWFYKTIPSQVARTGLIKGLHRNQVKKQKLIRFIEGLY